MNSIQSSAHLACCFGLAEVHHWLIAEWPYLRSSTHWSFYGCHDYCLGMKSGENPILPDITQAPPCNRAQNLEFSTAGLGASRSLPEG
jgi:hypothetical protein